MRCENAAKETEAEMKNQIAAKSTDLKQVVL